MKNVIFLEQGMENFCNHIDPLTYTFDSGTLMLITGPNGSGKTSMLQALPFTLYGVCEKGRGDDVVNEKIGKNCKTWTKFSVNETNYRIERYVKYTKFGNTVLLFRGDDDKPYKKGQKEVLPEVEKLVAPKKAFENSLLFSQKIKTFFTDLTDSEQKDIFRKIMGSDKYTNYHKQAGIKLTELQNDLAQLDKELEINQKLQIETEEDLVSVNEELKEFQEKKDKMLTDLRIVLDQTEKESVKVREQLEAHNVKNYEDKLEVVNNSIGSVTKDIDSMDSKLNQLRVDIDTRANAKAGDLKQKITQKKLEATNAINKTKEDLSKNEFKEIRDLDDRIAGIDREINRLDTKMAVVDNGVKFENKKITEITDNLQSVGAECPSCGREINEECIEKQHVKIEEIDTTIQGHLAYIDLLEKSINDLAVRRGSLQNEKLEKELILKDRIKDLESKYNETITSLNTELTSFLNKLEKMKEETISAAEGQIANESKTLGEQHEHLISQKEELLKLINNRDVIKDSLSELENNIRLYTENIKRIEDDEFDVTRIKKVKDRIKALKTKITKTKNKIKEVTKKIGAASFWKTGFSISGIQSMLIDDAIPYMNHRISYYLDILSGGRYMVSFDTISALKGGKEYRDKISIDILDNETHANSRVRISGGQKRLIDIATILTLYDLQSNVQNVSFNVLLFDEIFDSLDDTNIGYVSKLLRMAAKDRWVGIVSHRHIDQIEADQELSFA